MAAMWLGVILIILPFVSALFLMIVAKWKADTTGFVLWIFMLLLAVTYFKTAPGVAFLASITGFLSSYPITLMVCTSIFMITYMQKTGALERIIVAFKTLGGEGKEPFQIMFINIGLGCFLVSIGATPVTMLPPIMVALGYSSLAAVALPAIGYDPLTTFALLAIPAVIFQTTIANLFGGLFPSLAEAGFIFSLFMPLVTTGIAFGMMLIAGGTKLLFQRNTLIFATTGGVVTGGMAILVNGLAKLLKVDGLVPLTGLFAGVVTCVVMILLAKILGFKVFNRSMLTEEDLEIEKSMPLWKAFLPWIFLVIFSGLTNFVPQIHDFLFSTLAMKITLPGFNPIALRVFWNAWFWVIISTVISMPFLGVKKGVLSDSLRTWAQRAIRPVFAAGIFFSVAYIMNWSGGVLNIDPSTGLWEVNQANNMIALLADASALIFGNFYPLIVPFVGLLGGFVSGSETSAIAMFTQFQFNTGRNLGLTDNGIVILGASNGIGGGLASVLSPAKIQNATAVIDKQGIEGEVIRKTAPIALLMTLAVAVVTLCWVNHYPWYYWIAAFVAAICLFIILSQLTVGIKRLSIKLQNRKAKKRELPLQKNAHTQQEEKEVDS